jgi:hypothetical protein
MASLGLTFPHIVCTSNLLHVIAGAGNVPFELADGLDAWRTGLFAFFFLKKIDLTDTARLMERLLRVTHCKYCRRAYG